MAATDSAVLVTGGTGRLGRHLVPLLATRGRPLRVLTRHPPAVTTSDGVQHFRADLSDACDMASVNAAVTGAEVIVHLAGSSRGDEIKTRHLIEAVAASGGRPHVVHMSVVGCDRTPIVSAVDRAMFGYMGAKLAAEELIETSGLPWTTLRSSQLHELVLQTMATLARVPVVVVPSGTCMQPVHAAEVAARLADLASGPPRGLVPEFVGPEVRAMDDLARSVLRALGKHRPVVRIRMPGRAAQAFREGANLSLEPPTGAVTWKEFLDAATSTRKSALSATGP
jgi:uncharacterized protein YbjT (DUF2867 family)